MLQHLQYMSMQLKSELVSAALIYCNLHLLVVMEALGINCCPTFAA